MDTVNGPEHAGSDCAESKARRMQIVLFGAPPAVTAGAWVARGGLAGKQLRVARAFGLGTLDNPVFPGMHEASALVAAATLAAARAAWSTPGEHGACIAGGMHHAMAAHASGFGVCNDVAVAIAWLVGHGAERVAYVDIHAHHGDGVQAAFYNDPRVLTISLHQHPETLFPYAGLPAESGGQDGVRGASGQCCLAPRDRRCVRLRAFHAVVPPPSSPRRCPRRSAAAGGSRCAPCRPRCASRPGLSGPSALKTS
jgi:hypothetical protein